MPWGRSRAPPSWWLIACVAPRMALVNATPADMLARAMPHCAAQSVGRSIDRARCVCTSRIALSA